MIAAAGSKELDAGRFQLELRERPAERLFGLGGAARFAVFRRLARVAARSGRRRIGDDLRLDAGLLAGGVPGDEKGVAGHLDVGGGSGPFAGLGEFHPAASVLTDRRNLAGDDDLFASEFARILGDVGEGDAARRRDRCTIHRFRSGRCGRGGGGPFRVGACFPRFDAAAARFAERQGTGEEEHKRPRMCGERRRERPRAHIHRGSEKTGIHGAHGPSA